MKGHVFSPRRTTPLPALRDPHGLKLYAISARAQPVDPEPYLPQLAAMKASRQFDSNPPPGFAIFHDGATQRYLVLCWWGNDNELFNAVAVQEGDAWVEDPARYAFCLWDLEVIWYERDAFIRHLYSGPPDLSAYRADQRPAT